MKDKEHQELWEEIYSLKLLHDHLSGRMSKSGDSNSAIAALHEHRLLNEFVHLAGERLDGALAAFRRHAFQTEKSRTMLAGLEAKKRSAE